MDNIKTKHKLPQVRKKEELLNTFKKQYYSREFTPKEPCKKCGNKVWSLGPTIFSWSCVMCGNMTFLNFGEFTQQIDILVNSPLRKKEFVLSLDKKKILAKKNEIVKKLSYLKEKESKKK